jgi:hypothetical protein
MTNKSSNQRSYKQKAKDVVRVSIDRVQVLGWPSGERLPEVPGLKVISVSFVRSQTSGATYLRVRTLRNPRTKTKLFIQYSPARSWLAKVKLTIVPRDKTGLQRSELEMIVRIFGRTRLLTVEVAFDFLPGSRVDKRFVQRYGSFGKSRPVKGRRFGELRYGGHHSPSMVRGYEKLGAYRVELELHSGWLLRHHISQPCDLEKLPHLLVPKRIHFVKIDRTRLATRLAREGIPSRTIIETARLKSSSLYRVLRYLRSRVGLKNLTRLLRPLQVNRQVRLALRRWSREWNPKGIDEANDE